MAVGRRLLTVVVQKQTWSRHAPPPPQFVLSSSLTLLLLHLNAFRETWPRVGPHAQGASHEILHPPPSLTHAITSERDVKCPAPPSPLPPPPSVNHSSTDSFPRPSSFTVGICWRGNSHGDFCICGQPLWCRFERGDCPALHVHILLLTVLSLLLACDLCPLQKATFPALFP